MAGIISDVKDSTAVDQAPTPDEPGAGGEVTAAALRGQMKIPPESAGTYDKIVLAGKKLLYSEQMAPEIQELMKGPGEVPEKLGQGVLALLAMLIDKSNGTLPPQLIIPAGVELVAEAGSLLRDAGAKVSKEDIAEGTAVLVEQLLQKAGVSMDQLPQLLGAQGVQGGEQEPKAPSDGDGDEEMA